MREAGRGREWKVSMVPLSSLLILALLGATTPLAPPGPSDAGVDSHVGADEAFPRPVADPKTFALKRLAPLFATGPLAEAKTAFDANLNDKAVALFDRAGQVSPLPTQARYLRALALVRLDRTDEAVPELLAVADLDLPLASRAHADAAAALEKKSSYAAAAAQFALVASGSPLHREAVLGNARTLALAGDTEAARAALESLVGVPAPASGSGRDLGAEALWLRADLLERAGQKHAAWQDYRRITLVHPLSSYAAEARARSAGLPPPTSDELLTRAELLLNANRNQLALMDLDALAGRLPLHAPSPSVLSCRVQFDRAKTLRKLRRHTEAVAAFQPVVDRCVTPGNEEVRAKALYLMAESESSADPDRAVKVYLTLADKYPKHSFADDALYLAADMALKEPDGKPQAKALLEKLLADYPGGDFAPEALFRLFWIARSDGNARAGLPYLAALELAGSTAESSDGRLRPAEPSLRARYWEAATLEDRAGFRMLAQDEPRSYYGELARTALTEPERPKVEPSPSVDSAALSLQAGPLLDDPNFQAGVELLRIGLPVAAAQEFARIDRAHLEASAGAEPLLLLAICLGGSGDARSAHAIAKTMLDGGSGTNAAALSPDLQRVLWQIAYPNAFRDLIERWAKAYEVPPDLMQALMREESALDPEVLSSAGAVGLTQLMPATANRLAHKVGIGHVGLAELQSPDVNIRLGTAYLGELLARYGGRKVLAVAAYNSGEGAVDRWLQQRNGEGLDAFVEDIPVAETRNYVKRVLTSEATYRSLYGSTVPVAAR